LLTFLVIYHNSVYRNKFAREQSVILRPEMIPYTAQMDIVSYGTGKWTNPFADKSGAYIFLPNGPAKVRCFTVMLLKNIFVDGSANFI